MPSWIPFQAEQNLLRAKLLPEKVSVVFTAIKLKII